MSSLSIRWSVGPSVGWSIRNAFFFPPAEFEWKWHRNTYKIQIMDHKLFPEYQMMLVLDASTHPYVRVSLSIRPWSVRSSENAI